MLWAALWRKSHGKELREAISQQLARNLSPQSHILQGTECCQQLHGLRIVSFPTQPLKWGCSTRCTSNADPEADNQAKTRQIPDPQKLWDNNVCCFKLFNFGGNLLPGIRWWIYWPITTCISSFIYSFSSHWMTTLPGTVLDAGDTKTHKARSLPSKNLQSRTVRWRRRQRTLKVGLWAAGIQRRKLEWREP